MRNEETSSRHVWVFRSGGLGDFLLTVPFLHHLRKRAARLTLVTRRSYHQLVKDDIGGMCWHDIDDRDITCLFAKSRPGIRAALTDCDIYSFVGQRDHVFMSNLAEAGCNRTVFLESRPVAPPHVAIRIFHDSGLSPPEDLFETAWLSKQHPAGRELWVHPGSGSARKNLSLETMAKLAETAVKAFDLNGVCVVLGEAERDRRAEVHNAFNDLNPMYVIEPALTELRRRMETNAGRLIGHDSGLSHLAAMLGIPTDVHFVSTDPEVWRPLGPDVTIHVSGHGYRAGNGTASISAS